MKRRHKGLRAFVLLLCSVLLLGTSSLVSAQPPQPEGRENLRIVNQDQTGLYSFVGIDSVRFNQALPGVTFVPGGRPSPTTALADITPYASLFGVSNPSQELQFSRSTGWSGSQTFRYQQVYQGIPVIAGEMAANYDSQGRLAAISGEIAPKLSLSVTPTVTVQTAIDTALRYVAKAAGVDTAQLTASTPALWIYDARLLKPSDFPARLVWRLEVTSAQEPLPIRYLVLVDAQLPAVLLAFNQIDTLWGEREVSASNGVTLSPVNGLAYAPALAPYHANPPGTTYNSNHTTKLPGAVVCSTVPTALTGAGSCDRGATVSAANMAHYFAYNTVNYYDLHFHRNSIDDAGMKLISNVNYREVASVPFQNAYWDGKQMTYGDGDIYTVDDVVAHELSHGVTEHSSGLFYYYESGAINESMSDVFGEFIDQANGIDSFGNADLEFDKWVMGEDMDADPIRDMQDPTIDGNPDSTQSIYYTTDPNFFDGGGVHTNSGVGNKAAYLMAAGDTFNGYTITALGNDKTAAIFYEANTNLLTTGADYQMLGAALVQACTNLRAGSNLLGITAADCGEVDEAVHAVGMHLDPAYADFSPSAELCPTAGQIPDYLFQDDIENGLGQFASGVLLDTTPSYYTKMPPVGAWQRTSTIRGLPQYFASGNESLFGINHPYNFGYYGGADYKSYVRLKNSLLIPNDGATYYLHFNHSFLFESRTFPWDGGLVEYSDNGGGSWSSAESRFDAGRDYNGTLYSGNPVPGANAFVGESHGYVSSRYQLSGLNGRQTNFRWVISADAVGALGWFLDDIQVYKCVNAPVIDLKAPDSVTVTRGGTYDMGGTLQGKPIAQTFTIRNNGSAALNLTFAAPNVTTGFSAANYGSQTVAVGATTTFNLTCLAATGGNPVSGTVSIYYNDPNGKPFTFTATCTVKASPLTAAPVRNLFATTTPTLTWNQIPWATGYEVQISQLSSLANAMTLTVTPPTALNVTTPPLVEGTYYWRVRAKKADGKTWGAWSAADSFVIDVP